MGEDESTTSELQRFCEQEAAWLEQAGQDGVVYCIPPAATNRLLSSKGRRAPLVNSASAGREHRFWAVCRRANACGVYGKQPIYYPCLWQPYGLTPEQFTKIYYPMFADEEVFDAAELMQVHMGAWERLKGYAGWLMTDPEFLRQRDALYSLWGVVSARPLPGPPYAYERALEAIEAVDPSPQTKTLVVFYRALNDLLRHWNLSQLTTWDLPLPLGPFVADDVWRHTQAMAQHSIHLVLPVHYPLTTTDALLVEIRNRQKRLAQDRGLDPHLAALPHYEFLGRMLEVQHLEQAIRWRYLRTGSKPGAITLIEHAMADALEISHAQTTKLRKAISACRRGQRDRVSWLNERDSEP